MFEGVPDDLAWHEAELARAEVGNLRYVDYSYWNELTDNTHIVKAGVENIKKGKDRLRRLAVVEAIVGLVKAPDPL